MKQCPLADISGRCATPEFLFWAIGLSGLTLGIFSALRPDRSIKFYQGIMARFNWRATPIDEPREERNTRLLGVFLTLVSMALLAMAYFR